jgi:hypothetical protein
VRSAGQYRLIAPAYAVDKYLHDLPFQFFVGSETTFILIFYQTLESFSNDFLLAFIVPVGGGSSYARAV